MDLMGYVEEDNVLTAAVTEQQLEDYLLVLIPQIGSRVGNVCTVCTMYTYECILLLWLLCII